LAFAPYRSALGSSAVEEFDNRGLLSSGPRFERHPPRRIDLAANDGGVGIDITPCLLTTMTRSEAHRAMELVRKCPAPLHRQWPSVRRQTEGGTRLFQRLPISGGETARHRQALGIAARFSGGRPRVAKFIAHRILQKCYTAFPLGPACPALAGHLRA